MLVNTKNDYKKVLIAAPEVQAIPAIDCSESLVEIKEGSLIQNPQYVKASLTEFKCILVRETIIKKLLEAQSLLPEGLQLRAYEGYISLRMQKKYFSQKFAIVRQDNPEFSQEEAFIETTKLVSPVKNLDDTINIPPHSTGGAVDVVIVNCQGVPLDFGMDIKDWAIVAPSLCETECEAISPEAKQNRKLLFRVMTQVGFVNYFTEWWHFSYGDKYWAFQLNRKNAIYSCCDEDKFP